MGALIMASKRFKCILLAVVTGPMATDTANPSILKAEVENAYCDLTLNISCRKGIKGTYKLRESSIDCHQ